MNKGIPNLPNLSYPAVSSIVNVHLSTDEPTFGGAVFALQQGLRLALGVAQGREFTEIAQHLSWSGTPPGNFLALTSANTLASVARVGEGCDGVAMGDNTAVVGSRR